MFEVLKTEKFNIIFSFLIGFTIFVLTIQTCKGENCIIKKAPSIDEMKNSTFKVGSKCYQFKPTVVSCPAEGYIEAFEQWRA
jgi:hypothetical protein